MDDKPRKSRFNFDEMGEADRRNLAATFLKAAEQFYDDPANVERFKQWQAQQKKKSRTEQAKT